MKHVSKTLTMAAFALASAVLSATPAHAGHTYAGIIDSNNSGTLDAGDALAFVSNTTGVAVASGSLSVQAVLATTGTYAGNYIPTSATSITWTALQGSSGLVWNGTAYLAANAWGASLGSNIELRIDSITGPAGASFSYWEAGATAPTYTASTGLTGGTFAFSLTDAAATIGDGNNPPTTTTTNVIGTSNPQDPYGHIHGRQFSFDTLGTYTVSYVLHDVSGIQADSSAFTVTYTATPEPATISLLGLAGLGFALMRRRSLKA